jgi:hypothetical protein
VTNRATSTVARDPDPQLRRLQELSSVLSTIAREAAEARRDARRLRQENAALRNRVSRLTREERKTT